MANKPNLATIQLPAHLRERLAQGHPWVYRNHVPPGVRLPTGAWVRLRCGPWSSYALWDAEGPIALRVFSERQIPDAAWVRDRARDAWNLREPLREGGTTAYRWLFGEGDGLPGLTVDRYGPFAVAAAYSAAAQSLLPQLAEALRAIDPSLQGILARLRPDDGDDGQWTMDDASLMKDERRKTKDEGRDDGQWTMDDSSMSTGAGHSRLMSRPLSLLWGVEPPDDLAVVEHGLRFQVDLQRGQKTGLFLDQRENRRFVESLSAGRSVLNCFAYTGGFSLYALRGRAREAVSADIGKGLAEAAAANIRLSGLDADRHTFVIADCFELLDRYIGQGRRFDIVILDPPSFAKTKQNRYAALRAYTRLNTLGARCVAPGGFLVSSSCTSQVGPEAFRELLGAAAAAAGRRLQFIHEAGQPLDHPVPAHFPEGRYLKFVVSRVGEIV